MPIGVLAGFLSLVVGPLFGAGGILFTLLGASANMSAGAAVGAALGVLGYFLGARWLRTATILLGVVAVFMAAASTGPSFHRGFILTCFIVRTLEDKTGLRGPPTRSRVPTERR